MKTASRVAMVLAFCCATVSAGPVFDARIWIGARSTSTDADNYNHNIDAPTRLALSALVGVRIDRVVVGIHGGMTSSSLSDFPAEASGYTAETYPDATTHFYTGDIGVEVAVDIMDGIWASGWLGASYTSFHSRGPAEFINNIDFYGAIPSASLNGHSTHPGFGVSIGYDLIHTKYGRGGVYLAIERQDVGQLPIRYEDGFKLGSPAINATSYDVGLSYAY